MLGQELENLAQWHQACTLVFTEYSGQRANETSYFFCNFNVALFVVQSPSCVRVFVTPWTAASQASLSLTISWSLLKFMSIALVMPSNHLILYHTLLLLPSIFPGIRDFSNESAICIRWPKYWSFSISPSSENSGLISLKIWFDLLAVQRTFRSLLQYYSFERHQFFGLLPSLWTSSHNGTWLLGRPKPWLYNLCQQSDVFAFQHTV